jgi:S1-C subfamily serine protease
LDVASFGSIALDVVLLLVVLGALIQGYSRGFFRILGGIAGMIAGGVAAFFLLPLIATWLPEWRVLVSVLAAVLLISIGYTIGIAIGNLIRRPLHKTPLKLLDKLIGALANTSVALLVISLLAFSAQALGAPILSQSMASSTVLRTLDSLMPKPVESFLAQIRTTVMNDGLPRVLDAVGVPQTAPDLPAVELDSPALTQAAASVVRITGNAPTCGTGRVGSGFVVSDDRVVTNAHVLAGVTELVVEAPNEAPRSGRIVYFDPVDDLAVLDVSGLDAAPLALSPTLAPGAEAAVMGFPFGGPFTAGSASVLAQGATLVPDIYGSNPTPRQVYTLAATVQPGNSGGPLLATDGSVAGVIFAKSDVTANVGYALTMEEVLPVIAQAPSLTTPVESGSCTP